jgi:hypothetical protein
MTIQPKASAAGDKPWDVCSNKCGIKLLRERLDAASGGLGGRRVYTDDQKLEVIQYAEQHGNRQASDRYGVHIVTVQKWRKALD